MSVAERVAMAMGLGGIGELVHCGIVPSKLGSSALSGIVGV